MKVVQKKICLVGDFAVGKTSLVRRFVEGRYDEKYLSTIGVMVSRKTIEREDNTLNLLIWDLVGGDELSHREAGYLVGAAGAIIVCDLTRSDTLVPLQRYARQLRAINPHAILCFVGNKADLSEQHEITPEELAEISHKFDSAYFITSAKTGQSVATAFTYLADELEN